jgi:hypothetical protein
MRSVNVFFNTTSVVTVTPISVYSWSVKWWGTCSRKAVGRSIDRILAYSRVDDSRLISIFKACRFLGGFFVLHYVYRGTQWCSWLRHCTRSRMVACSIPDRVTGISHRLNPFDKTMALGSTQLLTEMNTRSISWGGGGGVKVAGAYS